MATPKHGSVLIQNGSNWTFHPGHTLKKNKQKKKDTIPLPTGAIEDIEKLIDTKHLSSGWYQHRNLLCINLTDNAFEPNSSNQQNQKLSASPRKSQSQVYLTSTSQNSTNNPSYPHLTKKYGTNPTLGGGYMGLHEDTQTCWEYITEEQYKVLKPIVGNNLPTMALSKLKPNEKDNQIEQNIGSS